MPVCKNADQPPECQHHHPRDGTLKIVLPGYVSAFLATGAGLLVLVLYLFAINTLVATFFARLRFPAVLSQARSRGLFSLVSVCSLAGFPAIAMLAQHLTVLLVCFAALYPWRDVVGLHVRDLKLLCA